ncbi:MAG: 50S ribosomal protein L13 [Ardenticatenaceae bacterium]|nr:50S ribosomal protein L13 [Ardenticatenaceae bacterium]MCB8946942.1 50S ribosomal protein L13 [Ardenticatenaceae bacterium]
MKTFITKPAEVQRQWFIVDAQGQTLGRLASRIATILRGKHKPGFSPSVDCGDYVVVINADKIHVTGRRMDQKVYYRHSNYPGGLTEVTLREQLENYPTRPIELAVKGMLPKNKLGRKMIKKLKVYAGEEHPHQAQQPVPMEL